MNIIIFGLGDFAKLMKSLFVHDSEHSVVGFCAENSFIDQPAFDGLPVFSFEDICTTHPPEDFGMFVAVGYSKMRNRILMYNKACDKRYKLVNFISSGASLAQDVQLGSNNVIMQGCQVEPFVRIGDNNIFWSSVNVCHDSNIGDHSFFAAQTLLGGFTKVANNCFFGFKSTVIQGLTIADETLVGACSLISTDTNESSKYLGTPARKVGEHKQTGIQI